MKKALIIGAAISFLFGCQSKQKVDLIVHNAVVYTVDSSFGTAEAFAVQDGKFIEVGSSNGILEKYEAAEQIDAQGKSVLPGLIDAHCHFLRYGLGLLDVNLVGAQTFDEVVARVVAHRKKYPNATWIKGRGWDQNLWPEKNFPVKDTFDVLFPDTPMLLTRVDGHAALVNQKALDLAGVKPGATILGGVIEQKNNKLTGILVDNAIDLVSKSVPEATHQEMIEALKNAERNCVAVGLTSIDDAGLEKEQVAVFDDLYKKGELSIRSYIMLSPSPANKEHYYKNGPYKTDRLNVRSFKIYADGALGSRGACLLDDYHDMPGHTGFLLSTPEEFKKVAQELYQHGFQMNTHCIGDSANHLLLDYYGQILKGKNDRRWRIEHAQVVAKADVPKFREFSVIPSVQPTHCTSDMYWADERLGAERIKTAYTYKDLAEQNNLIAFGSDFPIEDINPFYGFHAAVARQDAKNQPEGGFQPENAMSREAALKGMTIWAAYSNFEEKEKGSIEKGKFADFVIMEQDIMKIPIQQTRNATVNSTFINGKRIYLKK